MTTRRIAVAAAAVLVLLASTGCTSTSAGGDRRYTPVSSPTPVGQPHWTTPRYVPGDGRIDLVAVEYAPTDLAPLTVPELLTVIDRACRATSCSADMRSLVEETIARESKADPDVVDLAVGGPAGETMADGHPQAAFRGLGLLAPAVFAAHHVDGTSRNIYDVVANVAAMIDYLNNRAATSYEATATSTRSAAR